MNGRVGFYLEHREVCHEVWVSWVPRCPVIRSYCEPEMVKEKCRPSRWYTWRGRAISAVGHGAGERWQGRNMRCD